MLTVSRSVSTTLKKKNGALYVNYEHNDLITLIKNKLTSMKKNRRRREKKSHLLRYELSKGNACIWNLSDPVTQIWSGWVT
uniref:Uncharacterized protein n=1 Tax=Anguilla anguilla TaxID=7936 RepID=A0A0E9T2S7_ANGAN